MSEDLNQNYQGAFDGHLTFGKAPALIVIDMVKAYLQEGSPLYAGIEDVLASCGRILAAARGAGIPVFHTNVEFTKGGFDGGIFYKKVPSLKVFEKGSPLGAFPDLLTPRDDEMVITKQYASAFFGTSLASSLTANGIDTLIITGVSTSGCIRATSIDTISHGFIPMIVREAVGDRHAQVHEANLFDIQAKYGEVISEAETLAHLAGR
jgi:maleamate amidohydrolase